MKKFGLNVFVPVFVCWAFDEDGLLCFISLARFTHFSECLFDQENGLLHTATHSETIQTNLTKVVATNFVFLWTFHWLWFVVDEWNIFFSLSHCCHCCFCCWWAIFEISITSFDHEKSCAMGNIHRWFLCKQTQFSRCNRHMCTTIRSRFWKSSTSMVRYERSNPTTLILCYWLLCMRVRHNHIGCKITTTTLKKIASTHINIPTK